MEDINDQEDQVEHEEEVLVAVDVAQHHLRVEVHIQNHEDIILIEQNQQLDVDKVVLTITTTPAVITTIITTQHQLSIIPIIVNQIIDLLTLVI